MANSRDLQHRLGHETLGLGRALRQRFPQALHGFLRWNHVGSYDRRCSALLCSVTFYLVTSKASASLPCPVSLQVWCAEFKVFRSLEFNAILWLVQIGDKYLYPLVAEEFGISPPASIKKAKHSPLVHLASPMGEFYRAVDTPTLPRSLAAPVPQQQKQKLEQAEWSRKGASLKKLSVLLDRDVKTFYTTRSDLHQVCLKNFTDTDDDARLPKRLRGHPRRTRGVSGSLRSCGNYRSSGKAEVTEVLRPPVRPAFFSA